MLLAAARAEAHKFLDPKHLRLGLDEDRLLVSVTYDLEAGDDAKLLRSLFDRDADRRLDDREREKLLDYLEQTALLWLVIEVNGQKQKLERLERRGVRLDLPADAAQNLGLAALYAVPLPEKAARLELHVTDRDKDAAKDVPVIVDLGDGDRVAFSSQGELHPRLRQIHRIRLQPGMDLRLEIERRSQP